MTPSDHISYLNFFNTSATAICLEDFSVLFKELLKLKKENIDDFEQYLNNSPDKVLDFAKKVIVTQTNPAMRRMLSYPEDGEIENIEQTFGPGAAAIFKQELIAIWNGKDTFESPATLIDANGKEIHTVISMPIPKSIEESKHLPVSIWDLTKLNLAQQELIFLSQILASLNEGINIVNADTGKIIYTNDRFEHMFGYQKTELLQQPVSILNAGNKQESEQTALYIKSELDKRGAWRGEIQNKRKDGRKFWCEVSVLELYHPSYGKVWASINNDISEQKTYNQKLWRQANYDNLTRLPNRKHFYEHSQEHLNLALKQEKQFALLFIDIDDFKIINDSLGHRHGDALLIEVASRIEQCIRQTDLLCRFGGDEFVILMTDTDHNRPNTIEPLAEKLLNALSAPYLIKGEAEHISASIGISTYPRDAQSIDELIQYADQAMYQAKNQGKNNYYFFTPELQTLAQYNRKLEKELRSAIKNQQLEIYLQPIIDTHSGAIIKAEALLRWQHPELGFIPPIEFIPIAEDTKLINELGEFVFEQCIKVIHHIHALGIVDFQISLNKSPIQFLSTGFATEINWPKRMRAAGLDSNTICIEITEGIFLNQSLDTMNKIETLKDSGFHFSIDDFGTGYSSLSYLNKVDFDFLKIDKSFIDSLESNVNNQAMCEAIIVMAHTLKMKVIAEGIETQEQFERLKDMKCDYCQGYYFSKPLPIEVFYDFISKTKKV
ncbi:MAG: GGDEF domain-containing protein [Oleispira sp.]|nr:GGDEF domain-containing protein [Oleispira sp.]